LFSKRLRLGWFLRRERPFFAGSAAHEPNGEHGDERDEYRDERFAHPSLRGRDESVDCVFDCGIPKQRGNEPERRRHESRELLAEFALELARESEFASQLFLVHGADFAAQRFVRVFQLLVPYFPIESVVQE